MVSQQQRVNLDLKSSPCLHASHFGKDDPGPGGSVSDCCSDVERIRDSIRSLNGEQPKTEPRTAAERSITEAERVPMIADKVPVDPVKGKEVLEAAKSGDLGTLRGLVKNASLANFFDRETHTAPLHLAASRGDLAVVQFLLDKGARVDAEDKDGKNALILAATKGYREMVELLLKRGANPTLSDTGGRTALFWALANGHKEIAEILRSRSRSR